MTARAEKRREEEGEREENGGEYQRSKNKGERDVVVVVEYGRPRKELQEEKYWTNQLPGPELQP